MKLDALWGRLVAGSLMIGGAAAARQLLRQRGDWDYDNRRVRILVDEDDVLTVATRTDLNVPALLVRLREAGATHVGLAEDTLGCWQAQGRMWPEWGQNRSRAGRVDRSPATNGSPTEKGSPGIGRLHLAADDPALIERAAGEFAARLPSARPEVTGGKTPTLGLTGYLPALAEMGLGFDPVLAQAIQAAGLGVIPRPVAYAWADQPVIERSLRQAREVGGRIVAFAGDLILGHEMHLGETLAALQANELTFAYYAESREQRGDWFIAKRRAPHVTLAYRMTRQQMIADDYHAAAHRWQHMARERGIRLCDVRFFRVVHATDPLECLHYLEHIAEALEGAGFVLDRQPPAAELRTPLPRMELSPNGHAPETSTGRVGLVPAGAAALIAGEMLRLPAPATLALAAVGAAGSLAVTQVVDRPRTELEASYPPSYGPKALALATSALAPLAALAAARQSDHARDALAVALLADVSGALALAALTADRDYRLRIEEYKGFDLDVWLPLLGAGLLHAPQNPGRRADQGSPAALRGLGLCAALGWWLTRRIAPDVLGRLDEPPPIGHTHHLSTATRLIGDARLALGPRAVRKWAGLAPFGAVLSVAARRSGRDELALLAGLVSAAGHAAALAGFRRPERVPQDTAPAVIGSWLTGAVAGLVAARLVGSSARAGE